MRKRVRLSETLLSIVASRSDQSLLLMSPLAHAKSICALSPVSALTSVSMYCEPVASMYSRNASGSAVSVSPLAHAAKPTAAAAIIAANVLRKIGIFFANIPFGCDSIAKLTAHF